MSTSPPGRPPAGPVGVIGAGIVGLATARLLALAGVPVIVFEKESSAGTHQTGHNSGVVHAGIYYKPGSAKATMTRHGVSLLKEYCAAHPELPYDERGKLVVARDAAETVKLKELERRSLANGVPGVQWLGREELRELEPDVAGVAAILSPTTAIVDYPAITRAFGADVIAAGGQVLTSTPVTAVRKAGQDRVEVDTPGGAHVLSRLVICAGLQADLLARQAGDTPAPEIIPFRGEYLRLAPHARDRVRRLIYPVPDPRYPFLGVHLTPRVNGESDLGPNAVLALAREGYRRTDVSAAELSRLARSGAFWRLARQHWMTGIREMRGSLIRRAYLAEARTYLPWLTMTDVTSAPAGVRAQAVDADGTLVDDFRITQAGPVAAVRNAPSPAATASMAIAEHIVAKLAIPGVSFRLGKQKGSPSCSSSILRFTSGRKRPRRARRRPAADPAGEGRAGRWHPRRRRRGLRGPGPPAVRPALPRQPDHGAGPPLPELRHRPFCRGEVSDSRVSCGILYRVLYQLARLLAPR
ncbi:MAG: putative FAD-dependent oxidoreductase [Actinomycetia bacterium]|nr:putative FAD-dependent oxidoreductase [Actinomycetes bacterium]